ncbi:MAG: hypothetical protein H6Q03_105 [Acidobacteria bacterium]|nr:hypothetical protein [Acidobacteriota bacterium]
MGKRDPRVDAYIASAAEFARPILEHLRELVHRGCPEVAETIKWGAPHFEHKGMLAGMAAFKAHATFGFWKGSLVLTSETEHDAMGQFGRLRSRADLPPDDEILGWVRVAARLNESGIRLPTPRKHAREPIPMPAELATALARPKHARARATFESLSPSHRREYLEWIAEAKTEATRAKRIATTLEWLAEGKTHSWKYQPGRPTTEAGAAPRAKPATRRKPTRNPVRRSGR